MLHFWELLSLVPHLSPLAGHTLPISWTCWLTQQVADRAFSLFTSGHLTGGPAHEQVTQHGPTERMQAVVMKHGCHGKEQRPVKFPMRQGYKEWHMLCVGGSLLKAFEFQVMGYIFVVI